MEMIRRLYNDATRLNLDFAALVVMVWLVFFALLDPDKVGSFSLQLIFSVVTAGLVCLIARQLGYFDRLRLVPRKSDFFILLVTMPATTLITVAVLGLLGEGPASDLALKHLMAWSALVGLSVFSIHYLMSWLTVRYGRRRKVVLDLTPTERAALMSEFKREGVDEFIEYLGREDLRELTMRGAESDIDFVIVSQSTARDFDKDGLLILAHLAGVSVVDYREMICQLTGRIAPEYIEMWNYLRGATPQTPLIRAFLAFKIAIEPVVAAALALLLAPLMLGLAICIKATSRGPIFYRQVRTGYLGRDFVLIKFRSMRTDAEAGGVQWSGTNDPRVTTLGRIMRATRLDELPQLWNVMKGEMSFIGPRPERPEIYGELNREIPLFPLRVLIRPGITGWAQVCSGYAASVEECKVKLEHDLFYIQHLSPRLDLIVLCKTIQVAIFGDRAAKREDVVPARPLLFKTP